MSIQVPYIFKRIVEQLEGVQQSIITDGDQLNVLTVAGTVLLGYTAARIGSSLALELKNVLFSRIAQDAQRRLAADAFLHLHRLDHAFYAKSNMGVLVKTIDRAVKGINFLSTAILFNILPTLVEIGLVCGVLSWHFGPCYALLAAGTVAAYATFTLKVTSWRTHFRKQMNQAENGASGIVHDSLVHHEIVKLYTSEHFEAKQYEEKLVDYEMAAKKTASSLCLLNVGQQAIFSLSLGSIMWLASAAFIEGTATIGDLVMVNGLIFQLSLPLNFLGSVYRELRQATIDVDALFRLLTERPKIVGVEERPLVIQEGKIIFDRVSLSYDSRPILRDVSFCIPAGSKVALVGSSGSGKSLLARLLLRFVDPQQGRITIDGQPIDSVSLDSLRRGVGLVPQDLSLFNRTIKYNVAYGSASNVTDQQIHQACKWAHIHDYISSLPLGYEARVGERGVMLSGGERQRIALARMLLRRPKIMIFDEATSALDVRLERQIISTIKAISEGHTCLFIAHRLSTIIDADLIVVMRDGMVVEQGRHSELLALRGAYYELWMAYLKEEASKA